MIESIPGSRPHLAPVIAFGVPPLRHGIDDLCRRELVDLTAALHALLHDGPQPCTRCTDLAAGQVHGERVHLLRPGADVAPADPKGTGDSIPPALPARPLHVP